MKKKLSLIVLVTIICVTAAFIYFFTRIPKGNTPESRESILNAAISKGINWTIATEIELDGYIISGAYSTDDRSTLSIFEPVGNGNYRFMTSTNRNNDEIIISGAVINGKWYDLVWFHGAKTEYAEITYTISGQRQNPLRFSTENMDILYQEQPAKEYSMQVVYYDRDGKKYE